MLSFPSQNDIKKIQTGRVYSKKQTRVTANQHIFKSGLIVIIFHKKKIHILSQLLFKRLKNTLASSILKKETWLSIFIQEDYSRRGIESYPWFKH